ncbi:MAG: hypothetical protein V9E86_07915 [Nitrosomonas sp.]
MDRGKLPHHCTRKVRASPGRRHASASPEAAQGQGAAGGNGKASTQAQGLMTQVGESTLLNAHRRRQSTRTCPRR